MKKLFAADISENDNVDEVFLVRGKGLSVGKTGKSYLVITLMDKSGEIEGRVWDDAENFSSLFETDDFVKVKGKILAYMGKLQIKVASIAKVSENDIDVADFLPMAERGLDEMFADLLGIIDNIRNPYLKQLLNLMTGDPFIAENLKHAPAAKGMHHVYIGGLMEHVLSLCDLAVSVSDHYGEKINRDLLLAGAILHDIGKTRELSYSRSFSYTDEGKLLGHITIGVEMIDEKIREIDGFPKDMAVLLKHMILSHHGEYEYGSPKRPKTLEATILSYLDDLDAKVNGIQSFIDSDRENGSNWTGYHRLFDRYIYKGNCADDYTVKEKMSDQLENNVERKEVEEGSTLTLFDNK